MRIIKLSFIIAACSCFCLLSSCSTYNDLFSSKSNDNSNLAAIDGSDNLTGFDDESDILPERPVNDWKPVAGLNMPTVYFAYDQSRIGTAQVKKLEAVAGYLERHRELGLIIEGHCDEKGSAEYNVGLGERRALSVRDYLERLGIPAVRLRTISYGSERPEVLEHTQAAWAKNRRAELLPAKM
jgi:peptidoglycan-associated lipoprotein